MPERSCPSCGLEVAPHQTLCPSCRTPIPSEAGPVAASAEGSRFTFTAPPPRAPRPGREPPPAAEPVGTDGEATEVVAPGPEPTVTLRSDEEPTTVAPPTPGPGRTGAPPASSAPAVALPPAGSWPGAPTAGDLWTASAPAGGWVPSTGAGPAAASAGTLGVPGAAVLDERGNLPGGVLAVAAAAVVAAGVFLPWLEVAGEDVSGWAASADAKVLLGGAALATVVGALLIGGARSLVLRLALGTLGLAAVGIGAFEVVQVGRLEDPPAELGLGIPVGIVGGVLLVAAGAVARHRRFR